MIFKVGGYSRGRQLSEGGGLIEYLRYDQLAQNFREKYDQEKGQFFIDCSSYSQKDTKLIQTYQLGNLTKDMMKEPKLNLIKNQTSPPLENDFYRSCFLKQLSCTHTFFVHIHFSQFTSLPLKNWRKLMISNDLTFPEFGKGLGVTKELSKKS